MTHKRQIATFGENNSDVTDLFTFPVVIRTEAERLLWNVKHISSAAALQLIKTGPALEQLHYREWNDKRLYLAIPIAYTKYKLAVFFPRSQEAPSSPERPYDAMIHCYPLTGLRDEEGDGAWTFDASQLDAETTQQDLATLINDMANEPFFKMFQHWTLAPFVTRILAAGDQSSDEDGAEDNNDDSDGPSSEDSGEEIGFSFDDSPVGSPSKAKATSASKIDALFNSSGSSDNGDSPTNEDPQPKAPAQTQPQKQPAEHFSWSDFAASGDGAQDAQEEQKLQRTHGLNKEGPTELQNDLKKEKEPAQDAQEEQKLQRTHGLNKEGLTELQNDLKKEKEPKLTRTNAIAHIVARNKQISNVDGEWSPDEASAALDLAGLFRCPSF